MAWVVAREMTVLDEAKLCMATGEVYLLKSAHFDRNDTPVSRTADRLQLYG